MKLRLRGVSKSFDGREVLHRASLDALDLHALVLIGPSGGGKTTLLRILSGLETPDSGTIDLNGESLNFEESRLHEYRKKLGIVFQSFNLFPHLSAFENICLPLEKVHGLSRTDAEDKGRELLSRFQLLKHADKTPFALSGGQKQRVAIVRALAVDPMLLVLDEPTSALDPEMTAEVLDVIAELKFSKRDFILSTHQLAFARSVADEIAFIADGQIVEHGKSREVLDSPKSDRCRKFLERILKY